MLILFKLLEWVCFFIALSTKGGPNLGLLSTRSLLSIAYNFVRQLILEHLYVRTKGSITLFFSSFVKYTCPFQLIQANLPFKPIEISNSNKISPQLA